MRKKHKIILIAGVCIGVIGAFLPAIIRARNTSAANACINNLRQLDGAKQQWALENHKTTNDVARWEDIYPYIKLTDTGEAPPCPEGGKYTLGRVGDPPKCSIGRGSHVLP